MSEPGRALRLLWAAVGLGLVAVGAIGLIVPGLPSTVFFVAAAWCFSRADERLENWLLGLPVVGRLVDDYRAGLGMPRTTKVVVSCIILLAVSLSAAFVDRSWVAIAILVTGAFGIGWVLFKVPTRESQVER
ncbi:MAG: YbaN family protein [Microthrixaceae bacterium]|jgi:hypothetical protein|nr:YbaN family protein [Microthrixaceae bacterium]HMS14842.1 YbaN family protein [Microthrixaceae bacterium]HMT24547.1 YbaN family protein [Microthrixaceae bacterium]